MLVSRTKNNRKLSMFGFDLVNGSHNFYALLEFDITNLRKRLREERQRGKGGSLFAFMLKSIGKCLELYPEFNSMINYKKTTTFSEVDINIPVEIIRDKNIYNKQYTIRDINSKSLGDITSEIEKAKKLADDQPEHMIPKWMLKVLLALPKGIVLCIFKQLMKDHKKVKEMSGTIFVTSVSMVSTVPGFIIPYMGGPKAVSIAIGSTDKKAKVIHNEIAIREIISITAVFNHDLVDGAPAARFINKLRQYIEKNYDEIIHIKPKNAP